MNMGSTFTNCTPPPRLARSVPFLGRCGTITRTEWEYWQLTPTSKRLCHYISISIGYSSVSLMS